MGNNLEKIITNIEERWLQKLFNSCEKQFSNSHLPSHDQYHHLRVWNNAKTLLYNLPAGYVINEELIERLIISVFFHDQGMSITPSKEHGKISRQLCKTFFEENHFSIPPHFEDILDSIEKHDLKNYSTLKTEKTIGLIQLLNIADDMDAFGIVGAYRYLEIYLMRKISATELHETVIENLNGRFGHLSTLFTFNKQFVKSQNMRFIATRNFYKDLNMQIKLIGFSVEMINGPIGVVNFIQKNIISQEKTLHQTISGAISASTDFYFTHFFEKLSKEI
jgi:HD superfamily phosphodiesterase